MMDTMQIARDLCNQCWWQGTSFGAAVGISVSLVAITAVVAVTYRGRGR